MKLAARKRVQNITQSLWLVPVLCVLIGMLISFTTIAVDRYNDYELLPSFVVGDPEAAMEILTTVAASMVNLAVLVLTIVLVVVQLAMGQFSPRIVQRLLQDRPSQFAIGLFVATFVHTLLAIREVVLAGPGEPGQVPGVAIVTTFVLALASIAVLVVYIHHIGQALRVSALVEIAGDNTRKLLDKVYPDKGDFADGASDPRYLAAKQSGVVTTIAYADLVAAARDAECMLELVPSIGEFVPAGSRLFTVHGSPDRLDLKAVSGAVILRMERTLDQDVAYGLRLLVDIGIRALSDSPWQDPTTAVQAIDRLHDCLRELVGRPFPDGRHHDEDGELRLVEHVMTWDGYVRLTVVELRLAGAGSPQVARRLQAMLQDLIDIAGPDRRAVLVEQRDLLTAASGDAFSSEEDVMLAQGADPSGLGMAAGHS
ncbi:MAG: DUF2254 domain-containing protein [Nocardioides sp.]